MNIVHALLGEHGILKIQIEALRKAAREGGEAATALFAEAVESHAHLEDELLFDPLEATGRMPPGPVDAMRAEHEEIEGLLERLAAPANAPGEDASSRARLIDRLCGTLVDHFEHEEHALFVLAARVLDAAALEELGARWAERRSVEIGQALAARY